MSPLLSRSSSPGKFFAGVAGTFGERRSLSCAMDSPTSVSSSLGGLRRTLLAALQLGTCTWGAVVTLEDIEPERGSSARTAGSPPMPTSPDEGPAPEPGPFPCLDAEPLATDPSGAIEQCSGGWSHRTAAKACPWKEERGDFVLPPSPFPDLDECTRDSQCTAGPYGACLGPGGNAGIPNRHWNSCHYGCETDVHCGPEAICVCGPLVGTCISATCRSDADCEPGLLCASYLADPGCDFPAFACQTRDDQCVAASDCTGEERCTVLEGRGVRECEARNCIRGRPFLVNGAPRLARIIAGHDGWACHDGHSFYDELSTQVRGRLADAWEAAGLLEHASIAAFARFTLELLAVGAPAELVELAGQAIGDETRHARQCFGLAARFRGMATGPDRLPIEDALQSVALDRIALTTFLEGCIGETVATLEALEAGALATDPQVRSVLAGIAQDEARHAELAWRFLQWALQKAGPDLGERLLAALECEQASAERARPPDEPFVRDLETYGVLPARRCAALRRAALREVVRPCLERLLSEPVRRTLPPGVRLEPL